MNQEAMYLAALFHDIGKLIERSKIYQNQQINEQFDDVKYLHARYTAFFLRTHLEEAQLIVKDKDQLLELTAYHHNPKNIQGMILQLADWLASSERTVDFENNEKYNSVQLRSLFGTLLENNKKEYYRLSNLSFSNIFPDDKEIGLTPDNYKALTEKMFKEFKRVSNKEELLFLLEKYTSFVPAQTSRNDPDVSLFDHSKLTAAIAVCLFQEHQQGNLNEFRVKEILSRIIREELDYQHFILINADLSGIQKFIFDIPSKGAVKSLKGKSTYLILLMETICLYFIRELELEKANIVYNGGGNFFILAPASSESKIKQLRKNVSEILFAYHQGSLHCNVGYTHIKLSEFKNFEKVWLRATEETGKRKKRWLDDIWQENYEYLFTAKETVSDDNYCSVCHSRKNVIDYEGTKLCSFCESFKDLTINASRVRSIQVLPFKKDASRESTYNTIINELGYEFVFNTDLQPGSYAINHFDNDKTLMWKLGAYNLPQKTRNPNYAGIKMFTELAENEKLAYLKIDVDNLGQLFTRGLKKPSLSRMSVLSRMLRIYFEGYLPHLIQNLGLMDKLYVVFSGGDDTFLIGGVESVLFFAQRFRNNFISFVSNNPKITFSAGIGIFGDKHPVIKATEITEHYLSMAKEMMYPDDTIPTKDKVTILGEVFSWKEFGYVLELFEVFREIVEKSTDSRGIIQKLINSTKGWKPILESAQKGKVNTQKVWRLRYFLRGVSPINHDKIIKIYEDMWFRDTYQDNKIKNHQIITVAAKLADLQTRK